MAHLRSLNNCSFAQYLSPSPIDYSIDYYDHSENFENDFSLGCFKVRVIIDDGLLEQSVGSGMFVVAVERTW